MMDSIPDVCDKCGSDDLDVKSQRTAADATNRSIIVNCNDCGHTVVDNTKVNYKSPVVDPETDDG